MCLLNSVIVTGGPGACTGFLCAPRLPKGRDARVLQSSGPTNTRNISSTEFSPAISKWSMKKQEGFPLSPGVAFDPPHCAPYLCRTPQKMEQSREFSLCFQFCRGRILNQMKAWSSCSHPCSLTDVSLCFTRATRGWRVWNMQLRDNRIIVLPGHKMPVQIAVKSRGLPVLHAPHSPHSSASRSRGTQMSSSLPQGDVFNHHG